MQASQRLTKHQVRKLMTEQARDRAQAETRTKYPDTSWIYRFWQRVGS